MSDITKQLSRAALVTAAMILSTAALAQQQLDVRTVVQKEEVTTNDAGETETSLVAPDSVVPGDKVVYTITFTNVSSEAADDVVVTNPIDANLTYVRGSAFGAGMTIEFSADGGQSWGTATELTVIDAGGERPAEPADYTHLRWTLDGELAPGATGVARFSATVD
jgi:uncharacterized repeat protein (TIGR01451 family)